MPKLDRFIALLLERDGTALRLETGKPIGLDLSGTARPVTKEPLTAPQILALLREITPDQLQVQLESEARLTFDYMADGQSVDVETARAGGHVHANIYPARPRRSTAAVSMPAEALLMETKPSPTPPAQDVAVTSRAEERIQDLLRYLVESSSSDLHLRVELPPMYRTHGELKEKEGEPPLTREDIEQMVFAIMPERNKQEYAETNTSYYCVYQSTAAGASPGFLWGTPGQ